MNQTRTALLLALVALGSMLGVGHAQAATPTPIPGSPTPAASPTAKPTQAVAVPAAPTGVHIDLRTRRVSWQDNSDNETGFRIAVHAASVDVGTSTVAANVTSFDIPAAAFEGGCGQSIVVSVSAFNDGGSSSPSVDGVAADCAPSSPVAAGPTTAPSSPRLLPPNTGTGSSPHGQVGYRSLIAVLVGSSLLLGGLVVRRASAGR